MRSTLEYDAFGPWIDEVRTVQDLPRLYRNAGIDPAEYGLVLKVPREIARRDATPDMHLYDYLLALGDTVLIVLRRFGDSYERVEVMLDQIGAIEDSLALLDGHLTLRTVDGAAISIPYNGAGKKPIQDLVHQIRLRYLPAGAEAESAAKPTACGVEPSQGRLNLGAQDIGLISAYQTLVRKEPGLRLITSIARRVITPASGGFERLLRTFWPVSLQASITVTDGREVQVLHRSRWLGRGDEVSLSLARTIVPVSRISAVQLGRNDVYERMRTVAVHIGAGCLRFMAPDDPEVTAVLAAVAQPHAPR